MTRADIWCLAADNRPQVVHAAVTHGFAVRAGADRALLLVPRSSSPMTVDEWRTASPQRFRVACADAFGAFGRDAPGPDIAPLQAAVDRAADEIARARSAVDGGSGLPKWAEIVLTALAGLLTALLSVFGGYTLSQRAREAERRHLEADALGAELARLAASTTALGTKLTSGTEDGRDVLETQQRAVTLASMLPADATAERARTALTTLEARLGSPAPAPGADAARPLRDALTEVQTAIAATAEAVRRGR